ncbi:MAG: hypothetical protein R2713_10520, partial [Ilumatobacteraceae bacterium]
MGVTRRRAPTAAEFVAALSDVHPNVIAVRQGSQSFHLGQIGDGVERRLRAHELAEAERRGAERALEERDREDEELHREMQEAEWTRMVDEEREEAIHRPDPLTPWMSVDVLRPLARNWSRLHDAATLYVAGHMETSEIPIERSPEICAAAVRQVIERIRRFDPVEAKWIDLAFAGSLDPEVNAADFDGQWAWDTLVDL